MGSFEEDIANDSPFLININLNSGTSNLNSVYAMSFDPNVIYVEGWWSDFWDYCMANIIDPPISFFKITPMCWN